MDVIDFKRDTDNDLLIANGDFVRCESTLQHQYSLLISEKGEYKQHPTIGVALRNQLLNETDENSVRTEIQKEFENDGMKISKMKINSIEDIQIEAEYGDSNS